MQIAMAQLDQVIGDLAGNARALLAAIQAGAASGVALVVTPELSLCGYPPEDLVLRPAFLDACASELAARVSTSEAWMPSTSSTDDGKAASARMFTLPCKGIADLQSQSRHGKLAAVLHIFTPHEAATSVGRRAQDLRVIDAITGTRRETPRCCLDLDRERHDDA